MEKIFNLLISNWIKGSDIYYYHGSLWIIFTETKEWVIELTKNKTLWYNHLFFEDIYGMMSIDVDSNEYLISKWVELNIIINKITYTPNSDDDVNEIFRVDWGVSIDVINDVMTNSIKQSYGTAHNNLRRINYVIKDGVSEVKPYRDSDLIDSLRFSLSHNNKWLGRLINEVISVKSPSIGMDINDLDNMMKFRKDKPFGLVSFHIDNIILDS